MWTDLPLSALWWGKIALTAICGAVCAMQLYQTKGKNGVGWFFISVLLIWMN